jgi:hypothetical protein
MTKYEQVLSPAAKRDLKRLPLNIQKDIAMVHLLKIAENPYEVGKPLVGGIKTAEAKAVVDNAYLVPKWEVALRREALIKNAHASTAIEGNPLSLDQVSELAMGRDIMATMKAKAEVLLRQLNISTDLMPHISPPDVQSISSHGVLF